MAHVEWEHMRRLLAAFCTREGHCKVPWAHQERGCALGVWLSRQWTDQRGGRLSAARAQRLSDVGVQWGGPPPPVRGLVQADAFNERKWDDARAEALAARAWSRERELGLQPVTINPFDEAVGLCLRDRQWRPYSAATDRHTQEWRRRAMAATTPAKPTIALKMDFSGFGKK